MWTERRVPLVLLLLMDLFLVWLLVVFRPEPSRDAYEHRMLVAFTLFGAMVVETLLCGAGTLLNKGWWQPLLYLGHCLASWYVFCMMCP